MASTFEYKFYLLAVIFVGGVVAKERGLMEKGMRILKNAINKQKSS